MALREVLVEFGAIFTGEKELKKADTSIKGLIDRVGVLATGLAAALGLGAIGRMTAALINEADALDETAQALGYTTQQLQGLHLAGNLNAVSNEELNASLFKLNRSLSDTSEAASPASKALRELGINVKETIGQAPLKTLEQIAGGIAQISDPVKRTGIAVDLFGRAGAKMLPFLSQGPEGIRKFAREVEDLGGGFDPDFVKNAGEIDNQMHRLNFAMRSFKVAVIGFFLPAILAVATKIKDWIALGSKLVKTTNIVQAALMVLGGVAAVQFARMSAALLPLIGRLLLIAAPLVLAALLIEDLITGWQGGESAIGDFLDAWFGEGSSEAVRAWFKEVSEGFSEMLSDAKSNTAEFRNNWSGALDLVKRDARNATQAVKDYFFEMVDGSSTVWAGFVRMIGVSFSFITELAGGALLALTDTFFVFINAVSGGWQQFWAVFAAGLDAFAFNFQVVWEDILYLGAITAASVQDAWQIALAGIDTAAHAVIGTLADLIGMIPGADRIAEDLRKTAPVAAPGAGGNADAVRAERVRRGEALAARAQDIDNRLRGRVGAPVAAGAGNGGAGGDTNVGAVNVGVTVPAGTPAATAAAARKGAAAGAREGIAAAKGAAGGAPNRSAREAIKGRAPAK